MFYGIPVAATPELAAEQIEASITAAQRATEIDIHDDNPPVSIQVDGGVTLGLRSYPCVLEYTAIDSCGTRFAVFSFRRPRGRWSEWIFFGFYHEYWPSTDWQPIELKLKPPPAGRFGVLSEKLGLILSQELLFYYVADSLVGSLQVQDMLRQASALKARALLKIVKTDEDS